MKFDNVWLNKKPTIQSNSVIWLYLFNQWCNFYALQDFESSNQSILWFQSPSLFIRAWWRCKEMRSYFYALQDLESPNQSMLWFQPPSLFIKAWWQCNEMKSYFIGRLVYSTQLSLCGQNYAVWNHPHLIALSAFSTGPKKLCLKK